MSVASVTPNPWAPESPDLMLRLEREGYRPEANILWKVDRDSERGIPVVEGYAAAAEKWVEQAAE